MCDLHICRICYCAFLTTTTHFIAVLQNDMAKSSYTMEPAEKRRKLDADELESLIKQGDNNRLKSVLQNSNNVLTQNSLLHMAVKHNNLDVLNFLLTLDYDVNARDSSGSTPLLLAASNNNLEAVQRLLDTDADVCVSNATGRSTFEILKNSGVATENLILKCLKRFSVSKVDARTKARILVATNCSLGLVVLFLKDAAVTKAVLNLTNVFNTPESVGILNEAMKSLDVENVRVLLHHGPGTDLRRRCFFYFLREATKGSHPKLTVFETFIRVLVDLDILDHHNVNQLCTILMHGHEEAVRMMLECDLDVYLRKSFGYQLVPYIFHNERLDAVKMAKDRQFNVNARAGFSTALHGALYCNSVDRIQYLLDLGADPNRAESRGGGTPIINTKAWGKKCLGKLFLQHGADVQAVNKYERTVLHVANYKPIIGCVLPQLAIVEAQGTPILQLIRERIARRKIFKDAYAVNCKEVAAFKKHKISKSVTHFTILAEKTEVLAKLLCDEDKISVVDKYCCKKKVHPYYRSTMKLKLQRALNIYRAKRNVVALVSKYCGHAVDSDHLVVEKIFGLLGYYDMVKLASV